MFQYLTLHLFFTLKTEKVTRMRRTRKVNCPTSRDHRETRKIKLERFQSFSQSEKPHQHLVSCRSAPSQVFFRQKTVVLPIPGFEITNADTKQSHRSWSVFFKKIAKRFIGNYWIVLESIYLGWKFFRKMSNDSWWWRSKASGLWWTRQPTLESSVRYLNSRKVRPSRHIDRNNSTTSANPILHVRQTNTPCLGSCVMKANVGIGIRKNLLWVLVLHGLYHPMSETDFRYALPVACCRHCAWPTNVSSFFPREIIEVRWPAVCITAWSSKRWITHLPKWK